MPHVIRSHWPPVVSLAVGLALLLWFVASVGAHDSWISAGGHRNAAGELCCGEGGCFVIPSIYVKTQADGYRVIVRKDGLPPNPQGIDKRVSPFDPDIRTEIVPLSEAQPSPDGAYRRCKRPDGSRRCFFAPPPNT
jgi:hypothetical protein